MVVTALSRKLAHTSNKPDAVVAFKVARRLFVDGRRIEMQDLAGELGINRATLFRWVGSRDDLLAEVIWSLAVPTFRQAIDDARGVQDVRVAAILGRFARYLVDADYFRSFLQREPERGLRLLTTRAGSLQQRMIEMVEDLLAREIDPERLPLPLHDCAYLTVRILETFVYTDIITGEQPDPAKAEQAIAALLR